jgi:hypothetical protein
MKTVGLVCLLLLLFSFADRVRGQVTINPGFERTLTQSDADGGSATNNGNVSFFLLSDYNVATRRIRAETSGGLSVGTGESRSQIFYEFEVGDSPGTTNRTVGAWISYSVDWQGFQLILSTLGTNASVNVDLVLRDVTASQNIHVEPIHSLDLKTYSYEFIDVGFDFNDSGLKVGTFSAVLRRGHTYRLTLRLAATLFVILPSGTQSLCDYLGAFTGGDNGRVELNSLFVKVGLDEKEVLEKLNNFENHRHIYLTGRGIGHNNVEAESSPPIPPDPKLSGVSGPPLVVTGVPKDSRPKQFESPKPR